MSSITFPVERYVRLFFGLSYSKVMKSANKGMKVKGWKVKISLLDWSDVLITMYRQIIYSVTILYQQNDMDFTA